MNKVMKYFIREKNFNFLLLFSLSERGSKKINPRTRE